MLSPETIAELQEKARQMSPESREQLHVILKHAETTGKWPKLSHHFSPEALSQNTSSETPRPPSPQAAMPTEH